MRLIKINTILSSLLFLTNIAAQIDYQQANNEYDEQKQKNYHHAWKRYAEDPDFRYPDEKQFKEWANIVHERGPKINTMRFISMNIADKRRREEILSDFYQDGIIHIKPNVYAYGDDPSISPMMLDNIPILKKYLPGIQYQLLPIKKKRFKEQEHGFRMWADELRQMTPRPKYILQYDQKKHTTQEQAESQIKSLREQGINKCLFLDGLFVFDLYNKEKPAIENVEKQQEIIRRQLQNHNYLIINEAAIESDHYLTVYAKDIINFERLRNGETIKLETQQQKIDENKKFDIQLNALGLKQLMSYNSKSDGQKISRTQRNFQNIIPETSRPKEGRIEHLRSVMNGGQPNDDLLDSISMTSGDTYILSHIPRQIEKRINLIMLVLLQQKLCDKEIALPLATIAAAHLVEY